MWGDEAWENDAAADWFGDLMDSTGLRIKWHAQMLEDFDEDESDKTRAALWLFAQLGRVYIWPIDHFDEDVKLALSVADKLLASEYLKEEMPDFRAGIQRDRDLIAERQK